MLDQGGNAVDAAIAAAFAVSVVEPYASGIGGGGSALIADRDGQTEAVDYREVVAQDGQIPASNTGIPGFVAGMAELHEQRGTLEWAELLAPAVEMAEGGVPVTETFVQRRDAGGAAATSGLAQFAPGGVPVQVGDEIVSSAAALPGVALIRMMQNLDNGGISEVDPNSVEHIRRVSEEWAGAEQIAQTELGDTDFVDVDYDAILGNGSGSGNADGEEEPLAMGDAPASDSENMDKPGNTTHITVVDGDGTVVSMTNTLTEFWGSGQEVGGFFLNDQLSRFSTVTSPNNHPEPGRRSVTWSNPTMVLDGEGRPVLGLGTPGGANILSILGNTLSRWALHGQSLEDAVAAPRFRLDSASGSLLVEQALLDDPVADQLPELGWPTQTAAEGLFGSVNALEIDWEQGTVSGPTDYRLEAGVVVSDAE